jgi:ABC-type transporter Mla MlaB component
VSLAVKPREAWKVEDAMYEARNEETVTLIRCTGELCREELSGIARLAHAARREGRMVVIDLKRVTHLHYAGAALLKAIPGLRAAGASRYVRDLVNAGGAGGHLAMYPDVEEALLAA